MRAPVSVGNVPASGRTPWTRAEWDSFVFWHERTIEQYSVEIQTEFRRARRKFMSQAAVVG